MYILQCDAPYRGHQSLLQIVRQSGCVNLIDNHASLQSSHSCKLNIVAWVVELTYLHVIVKCESLLGGHGKARCTVTLQIVYKEYKCVSTSLQTISAFLGELFSQLLIVNCEQVHSF